MDQFGVKKKTDYDTFSTKAASWKQHVCSAAASVMSASPHNVLKHSAVVSVAHILAAVRIQCTPAVGTHIKHRLKALN